MVDKGDLDIKAENRPTKRDPVYKLDHAYTAEEFAQLKDFMHAAFAHIKYGDGRDKGIFIEYPPQEACSPEKWKEIMDTVLEPELETLDLYLKRKHKIVVRFTDRLRDPKKSVYIGGIAETIEKAEGNEVWIRVNQKDADGKIKDGANFAFVIMHELLEKDFWQKTKPDDFEAKVEDSVELNLLLESNQKYRNLLDEKVANRRALRAIRRMWPEINWGNLDDVYEEDK